MDDRRIKEEYKRVFDAIHADDALKERILEMKPQKRSIKPVITAVSTAAAAVVIFTAVGSYNFSNDGSGVISETTVSDRTERPSANETALDYDTEEKENEPAAETQTIAPPEQIELRPSAAPKKTTNEYKAEALSGIKAREQSSVPSTQTNRQSSTQIIQQKPQQSSPAPAAPQQQKPSETPASVPPLTERDNGTDTADFAAAAESYSLDKTAADKDMSEDAAGAKLKMNTPPISANARIMAAASVGAGGSGESVEQWDNDRYFDYIGTDITANIEKKTNFRYSGAQSRYFNTDSGGNPVNDEAMFVFEADGGKYINITVTKNTAQASEYLTVSEFESSDIAGTKAVVFDNGDSYTAYMIYNGISYTVDAASVTETELYETLAALVS